VALPGNDGRLLFIIKIGCAWVILGGLGGPLGSQPILPKPSLVGVQWARKVYATVADNDTNSKCYISGQRRARKAPFLAFDAAWAGLSQITY
jgi:hypothetical protein